MQNDATDQLMVVVDKLMRGSIRMKMGTGRPYGLRPLEMQALEALYCAQKKEEEVTPSILSGTMEIHSPILSPILTSLEQGGYLIRRNDREDRRRINLSLTSKGTKTAAAFVAHKSESARRMADYFGEEDTLELIRLAQKLNGFLAEQYAPPSMRGKGAKQ